MRSLHFAIIAAVSLTLLSCGGGTQPSSISSTDPRSAITVSLQPLGSSPPIMVSAAASSSYPVRQWTISVDSTIVWKQQTSAASINQPITIPNGKHEVIVQAWNSAGNSGRALARVDIVDASGPASDPDFTVSVFLVGSSSPVKISATATSPSPLTGWAIYLDGVVAFRKDTSAESFSQSISMSKGTHHVVVRAWNNLGAYANAGKHAGSLLSDPAIP